MPEIERYSEGFDEFRDHPDSAFYAATGLSPEETNREIVRSMDRVLHTVIDRHQCGEMIPISADALRDWHREIFASTFPDDAGRLRWKTDAGLWEMVSFGINIGTQLTRRVLGRQGAKPRAIPRRLDRVFAAYVAEFARAQREGTTLHAAALNATHVYAKALSIHPFVDGNLRASFIAPRPSCSTTGCRP